MALTFRGGIHINEYKETSKRKIEKLPAPARVAIPMSQHIGAPAAPCVAVGDTVDRGQPIGLVERGLGCPVHASISGKVVGIEERLMPSGMKNINVIIENDFEDRTYPGIAPFGKKLVDTTLEEITEIVRAAGIVGMGGATFPTYAKIQSAIGKVDYLIINAAECEPYITSDHRILVEQPASVVNGLKILLKALGLRRGIIAVEDNKPDAIKLLEKLTEKSELIEVKALQTKYPQGDERQIIYAITGRELPAGKLPADVGCVVFNTETCAAVFNAFISGMPVIERIVTVNGDCVNTPKNILAPIGASYEDLIAFCDGLSKPPKKVVNGGPMMGIAQWDITASITKGTSALLIFSDDYDKPYAQPANCIRCGKCVAACPMHLMPAYLALFVSNGRRELCEKYNIMNCVECGCCSYICPAQIPIVQYIRLEKNKINTERRALAAKQKAEAEQKEKEAKQ